MPPHIRILCYKPGSLARAEVRWIPTFLRCSHNFCYYTMNPRESQALFRGFFIFFISLFFRTSERWCRVSVPPCLPRPRQCRSSQPHNGGYRCRYTVLPHSLQTSCSPVFSSKLPQQVCSFSFASCPSTKMDCLQQQ